MILDVYVCRKKVGILEQHDPTCFSFSYLPDTPKEYSVSLLMPSRKEPYTSSFLFPIFQVSLPEGYLRQKLERTLAKKDKPFDDMGLLAATGHNLIGRVRVIPSGVELRSLEGNVDKSLPLDILLNDDFLSENETLDKIRHKSGISGGFPKFLARSSTVNTNVERTIADDNWIIKLNDPEHKNIVVLEYFGMMAAEKMKLDVPKVFLAPNHNRIFIKRFDVKESGSFLGFEDMCALMGMPSREKFNGSVEKIVKTIRNFCKHEDAQRSCEQFYAQYLLAATIRNGDAHLKNFGLLYGRSKAPMLSPVYDMLSMAVYAPANNWRDADDGMALTLGGTRRWPNAKALEYLGDLCEVSNQCQQQWKGRLVNALLDTSEKVLNLQTGHVDQDARTSLSRMIELWDHGMRQVDEEAAEVLGKRSSFLFSEPTSYQRSRHRPE